MRFVPLPALPPFAPAGAMLVLPMFGVGNTGPLAVDALITTYGATHVGYLESADVLPAVGNDALAITPADRTGTITLPLHGTPSCRV